MTAILLLVCSAVLTWLLAGRLATHPAAERMQAGPAWTPPPPSRPQRALRDPEDWWRDPSAPLG